LLFGRLLSPLTGHEVLDGEGLTTLAAITIGVRDQTCHQRGALVLAPHVLGPPPAEGVELARREAPEGGVREVQVVDG
jgi:hypothetical protein